MKKKKLLCWMLSLVMALTVFSIPVGAVYADTDVSGFCFGKSVYDDETGETVTHLGTNTTIQYAVIANENGEKYASEEICVCSHESDNGKCERFHQATSLVWYNDTPGVAGIQYPVPGSDDQVTFDGSVAIDPEIFEDEEGQSEWINPGIRLVPKKAETAKLRAVVTFVDEDEETVETVSLSLNIEIAPTDLPTYCLAGAKFVENEQDSFTPYIGSVAFSKMVPVEDTLYYSLALCSDIDGFWSSYGDAEKLVWTNSNPKVAAIRYWDRASEESIISSKSTFTVLASGDEGIYPYFELVPWGAGDTQLTLDVYSDAEAETPMATVTLEVTDITQTAADKVKFKDYLNMYDYMSWEADIDSHVIEGDIPAPSDYNDYLEPGQYKITDADVKNMTISTTAGNYTTHPVKSDDSYTYKLKFSGGTLGSYLTVTYKMGTCTRTEKIIVSKWVDPTVAVKTYTWDGKVHKPSFTVKVGSTTLKSGKDFEYDVVSRKDVGRTGFGVWNTRASKYKFYFERPLQINPKGTSLSKLKKAKKAITVNWKKQAAKMSSSRITGYQIQLATNKAFTKNKKLVTVKGYGTVSKKVKKLKAKKKYFVRIRTYKTVGGQNYYSPWSAVKTIKTK